MDLRTSNNQNHKKPTITNQPEVATDQMRSKTMKKTLKEIVQNAMDNKEPHAKLIQAIYWMARSEGQESAECKIRENLHTLPMHRYYRVQAATIDHLLKDNPCAIKAPVMSDAAEIAEWEFDI